MQTIKIQNCTDYKDKFFKLIVNGEKHVMPYQLTINVDDDKPFKIKAKYFWSFSREYTFEPKDNMSLQIFRNGRAMKWFILVWVVVYIFGMIVMKIYGNIFYAGIILIIALICEIIRGKSYFVIREVNANEI